MAPVTKKKKKKDSQKHEVTQWPNAFLKRKCSPNHCPQRIAWLILLWPGYRTQVLTKWNTGSLDKSTDIATRGMKKNKLFLSFPFYPFTPSSPDTHTEYTQHQFFPIQCLSANVP